MSECKDKCWCRKIPKKDYSHDEPILIPNVIYLRDEVQHLYEGIEKCFERIEKIDNFLLIKDRVNESVQNRLNNLEGYMEMEDRVTASDVLIRLTNIEERLKEWNKWICMRKTMKQFSKYFQREPHQCPLCAGIGRFDGAEPNKCPTCEGTGIVWEPKNE